MRNNANEQALRCDSASSASSNNSGGAASAFYSASSASSNNSGGAASAFSAFGANKSSTIVETVQEDSDDGDGLTGNAADDNVQVNLTSTSEICEFEICDACDSGIALGVNQASSHTTGNLIIDTDDPGQEDFVISVGALGNASGTPLDGSQNMSFGEDLASPEERRIVDSATKAAAYATYRSTRPGWRKGACEVKVDDGSESSVGTPPNFDPSDPKVLGDLLSRPPEPINHSPTSTIKFNEQTVVTEYAQGGAASTTVGNLGGAANTRPSSSLPGSAALRQHTLAGGDSNGGSSSPNGNPNGNPC